MENYFRYLPVSPDLLRWGIALSASGFTRVPPGATYPPAKHPEDHQLDWKRGRVIDALQIVLISEGQGWLETRNIRRRRVEADMMFLLLPNSWHRYRPDPSVGWVESWIEVRGTLVDDLLKSGTVSSHLSLRRGALQSGLEETLNHIHQRVLSDSFGNHPELSALAMQTLSRCTQITAGEPRASQIERAIQRAERHLQDHYKEPLNIEELAENLGVAYSHFRRAFRAQTGFSPWQYVIHLRLTRARYLMASTDTILEDVAAQVGFSSGFHLSNAFKQAFGISPTPWRKALLTDTGAIPQTKPDNEFE
jgi:AraC-like DNA-binding protein